jgi:ABC-type antimicrobial peptide transport system permease subunit
VAVAAAIGIAAGLVLCAAVLRTMHSVLYGVKDYDPASLSFAVLALVVVAGIATAIPALRISRIDPAQTLREE